MTTRIAVEDTYQEVAVKKKTLDAGGFSFSFTALDFWSTTNCLGSCTHQLQIGNTTAHSQCLRHASQRQSAILLHLFIHLSELQVSLHGRTKT